MIKYVFLTAIISCVTTTNTNNADKQEMRELAYCKNTLQHDIHRDRCVR